MNEAGQMIGMVTLIVMCHLLPQSHRNFVIAVVITIITQMNIMLAVTKFIIIAMEVELPLHLVMSTVVMMITSMTPPVEEGITDMRVKVGETSIAIVGTVGLLDLLLLCIGDLNKVSNLFFLIFEINHV